MSEAQPQAAAEPTTLAVIQLVATQGAYPEPWNGGTGTPAFTLGMIHSFAGQFAAFGALGALGQLVSVQLFTPLYTILRTWFGGDGVHSFGLPQLIGTTAVGGSLGVRGEGSLGMTYMIATGIGGQAPLPGMIVMFGNPNPPDGWLEADGSTVPIADYGALFNVIGTTFGGDGTSNFALPNLDGAAPVGIGMGASPAPVVLGETVPGAIPGLGLVYLICVAGGAVPTNSGAGAFPSDEPWLGQIIAYAGGDVPPGWAQCVGSLLPIQSNTQLYTILGTSYGGDGVSNFALPNLAGLMTEGRSI